MKRLLLPVGVVVVILILLLFMPRFVPIGAGPAWLYALLLLMDVYLWLSLKSALQRINPMIALLMGILFWLPAILISGAAITLFFEHFAFWHPTLRVWLFAFVGVTYASKILPAFFLLLSDVLRLSGWLVRQAITPNPKPFAGWGSISRSSFLRYIGLLGGGLIFSSLLTGMIRWVYDFKVHRVALPLRGLGRAFAGYKIVQISDLHLGSWTSAEPLEEAIKQINALNPDLVVFTGDLVNYQTGETGPFGKKLQAIKAPDGVIAVLGNHDYGNYITWNSDTEKQKDHDKLLAFYKEIGWQLLNNDYTVIKRGGDSLAILGVENWGANPRFPKLGDLEKALSGLDTRIEARILLSHDPTHWQHIVSKSYSSISLTLSGHTHGMQMGIENKNFRWSPAQYLYRYWAGLYRKDDTDQYLYVNRGIGHIGYPGRIGIKPEITLIELKVSG